LLLALFGANAYRARTQAITIDEAYTYNLYVSGPLLNTVRLYNANNHVLYSVLCRISGRVFGQSELAARLPSLVSNKRLAQQIRNHHAFTPNARARIGAASWGLEPGLNFYRTRYRMDWMDPIDRGPIDAHYDYYVALPDDMALLAPYSLKKIYEDPVTHAVLAVPNR
jgi:hypothetical protein